MHTLLVQGSVGLTSSRRARWPGLYYPGGSLDVVPTKTPGLLHHSWWSLLSFVEHFAQVSYTFLVLSALFSYRYLFVRRQSICILSLIFLCHRLSTAFSAWLFPGTGGKGVFTQQAHGEFIVSSETICPPITHQAHGGYFLKEFLNLPTYYPPGTWWVLFKSAYDSAQWK